MRFRKSFSDLPDMGHLEDTFSNAKRSRIATMCTVSASFSDLHYHKPCPHSWQVVARLRSPVKPTQPSPMFLCYYKMKCIHCPQQTIWDTDQETGESACDLDPRTEREMSLDGSRTLHACKDCGNWSHVTKKA